MLPSGQAGQGEVLDQVESEPVQGAEGRRGVRRHCGELLRLVRCRFGGRLLRLSGYDDHDCGADDDDRSAHDYDCSTHHHNGSVHDHHRSTYHHDRSIHHDDDSAHDHDCGLHHHDCCTHDHYDQHYDDHHDGVAERRVPRGRVRRTRLASPSTEVIEVRAPGGYSSGARALSVDGAARRSGRASRPREERVANQPRERARDRRSPLDDTWRL
jgi:hypothetical protein